MGSVMIRLGACVVGYVLVDNTFRGDSNEKFGEKVLMTCMHSGQAISKAVKKQVGRISSRSTSGVEVPAEIVNMGSAL